MVGGSEKHLEAARPFLGTFATKILHMGEVGNGQLAKALNNCLYNVSCAAMAEMLPFALRAGLPMPAFVDAVTSGTGQSFGFNQWAPLVLQREFEAPKHGFPMGAAFKDLETLVAAASAQGLPVPPVVAATLATYQRALAMGLGEEHKGNVSGTTLLVAAQLRLPLCALLRCVLLNRGQTWMQWQLLFVITLLCVGHVIHDLGDTMTAGVDRTWIAASPDGILIALPLVLGKCLVSCCGAVHAEYFLQHKETKQVPLWITQVHFKTATIIGALTVALFMGNVCERILSDRWHNDIFSHLPNDVSAGDPRIPFFGGWDSNTWILAGCLILNNFLVADQMRNLTSIAKYVAYAIGLVLSYLVQLWEGRAFCAWQ
ncbi:Hgd, partial [Symbiodinium necroappetens]